MCTMKMKNVQIEHFPDIEALPNKFNVLTEVRRQ